MFVWFVRRLLMVGVPLILPVLASAQEVTLSGTVADSTGGVLPGATVTAVHEASGNIFEGVTDVRGAYRIAARAGVYRLTVDLPGFGSVNRQSIELLVGQQAVLDFELSLSTVQESIRPLSSADGSTRSVVMPGWDGAISWWWKPTRAIRAFSNYRRPSQS